MYVLLGSGALAAFCSRAAQQAAIEAGLTPVAFFAVASAEALGTASAMGCNSTGCGGGAACGAALGKGGGGSSFLQAVSGSIANIDVRAKQQSTGRFMLSSRDDYLTGVRRNLGFRYGGTKFHRNPGKIAELWALVFGPTRERTRLAPFLAAIGRVPSDLRSLTAAHRVTAIETFVTGAVAHRYMSATITYGRVSHHFIQLRIQRPSANRRGRRDLRNLRWGQQ